MSRRPLSASYRAWQGRHWPLTPLSAPRVPAPISTRRTTAGGERAKQTEREQRREREEGREGGKEEGLPIKNDVNALSVIAE